ncbi:hypothetical protein ROE7235_00578 [Roseibaca ekhonensis]|uniref:DUF3592 domain-containing protein n=2 Tax=Roseinatronobacter ekhonensis TaxID=254356 RepID=A0A3B0MMF6_9RHOB|nr:hypothetical protein ROE7235_00578 [Roseibaca ekhonensis]
MGKICVMMDRKPLSYPRLFWRLGLVWLAVPLVLGLAFTVVAWVSWTDYRALQRDGVVGETEVIAREIVRRRDSDGDQTLTYYLTHSFRPEGYSDVITTRQSVGRGVYLATQEGDYLPVTYIWNQPERNTLDPKHDMLGVVFFGLAGGVLDLVALGGLVWGWGRVGSARRALLHGEVREARVTQIRKLPLRVNGRARYRVAWQDATGLAGKSLISRPDLALAHTVGDVIVIYVDPRGGRGWWQKQI